MDRKQAGETLGLAIALVWDGRMNDAIPLLDQIVDGIAYAERLAIVVPFARRALDDSGTLGPWHSASKALPLYLVAVSFLEMGRAKEAGETLADARTIDPHSPLNETIDAMIIEAQRISDPLQMVMQLWLRALAKAGENPEIHCGYARYLMQARALNAARRHIEIAIEKAPAWQLARCVAAEISIANQDINGARLHLHAAASLAGNKAAFDQVRKIAGAQDHLLRRALFMYTRAVVSRPARLATIFSIGVGTTNLIVLNALGLITRFKPDAIWACGIVVLSWTPFALAMLGRRLFRVRPDRSGE